jgi:protein tyrosine phosphatase
LSSSCSIFYFHRLSNNFILADRTRVKLCEMPDVCGSDYINANYIDVLISIHIYIHTHTSLLYITLRYILVRL